MVNRQSLVIAGLIGVIIFLLSLRSCEGDHYQSKIDLLEATNDTLVKKRNKDGSQTATIQLLQAEKASMLLKLKTNDETIKWLQAEVRKAQAKIKRGGSVTTFSTATTYTGTSGTSVQYSGDSCSPIYNSINTNAWISYTTQATKDSTTLHLKVKSAYSVVIGREKIGLFKYRPIVEVNNFNPYSDVTSLRAFEVKEKKRRWVVGAQVTYGMNMFTMKPGLVIGGGVTYKLLEL